MSGSLFVLAVWLGCLLGSHESFRSFSSFSLRRQPSRYELSSGFTTDFEKLSGICQEVAVPMNTTATLINLIQYGDIWAADSKKETTTASGTTSGAVEFNRFRKGEKVPGCMADVRITATFSYPKYADNGGANVPKNVPHEGAVVAPRICIEGSADSRVAQGILALLCQGLDNMDCTQVLGLSPTDMSQECGLNTLLPRGRLNGLHNMVTLIQNQIKRELQRINDIERYQNAYSEESRGSVSERSSVEGSVTGTGSQLGSQSVFSPGSQSGSSSGSSWTDLFKSDYNIELEGRDTSDEVAVLLSGGVDSSVALKLLQLQGHKVRAFYLKIWLEDEVAHLNECPWEEDLGYAESVCEQLGVPLETLSLQKEYWQEVVQYTFREAKAGRTPNPDILCNSRIKFGMFYEYVGKYYSKIATGHYAQVLYGDESVEECSRLMIAESLEMKEKAEIVERERVREREGGEGERVGGERASNRILVPSAVIEIGEDDDGNSLTSLNKVLRDELAGDIIDRISSSISNPPSEGSDESKAGGAGSEVDTDAKPFEQYSVTGTDKPYARLVMSPDGIKDQTYFLSALSQEQLAKAIFPIGHLRKQEVRRLAELYQLPTRARKDSQGICFLGKLKFDEFIEHYLGENEGVIRCYQTGKILGEHRGLWFHTIGQRKGLGPHLQSVVHDGPWFVAGKDSDTNTLYVTNNLLLVDRPRVEFRVHKINWVAGGPPLELIERGEGLMLDVKLRHGPTLSRGRVTMEPSLGNSKDLTDLKGVKDELIIGKTEGSGLIQGVTGGGVGGGEKNVGGDEGGAERKDVGDVGEARGLVVGVTAEVAQGSGSILRVILDKRDKGIAPGQFAAFYRGAECLGSGVIVDTAADEICREEEHVNLAVPYKAKSVRVSPVVNTVNSNLI